MKYTKITQHFKTNEDTMKICQVNPGLISIPPNGWGAVEKIIWNYKLGLEKLGHTVDIRFPDEIEPSQYDAVHVHVANQALMLRDKKIPYIFTMHDHHSYVWGIESFCYKQNKEAIEGSRFSLVPAEYLMQYFGHPYKTFYLPHGVDTTYFSPKTSKDGSSLLCVANNGFINNQAEDRKGFRYAIEAAKRIGLPITIAGPSNNKKFFEANVDLLDYGKLTIKYDLDEDELLKTYDAASIFIHASSAEAGHPNLTLLEALSMKLPIVGTYEGSIALAGLVKASRSTNEVEAGIRRVMGDYSNYSEKARKTAEKFSYDVIAKRLEAIYSGNTKIEANPDALEMKDQLVDFYETAQRRLADIKQEVSLNVTVNFIRGAFCEIRAYGTDKKYRVQFIDPKNSTVVYENNMLANHWSRASREWYTPWTIKVYDGDTEIYEHRYDAAGKRVYIHLDSKSLGDTLAWFPYVDEFRKKHNCKVICSTFWNHFFEKEYLEIDFVKPGTNVENIYAMYNVGWFHNKDNSIDYNKNVYDFKKDPLQKTSSDILGLTYSEIKPRITIPEGAKQTPKNRYVCIGMHSTSQCKYWNNPTGWQDTANYIKSKGYDVWHISKEKGTYMGNTPPKGVVDKTGDFHINERIKQLVNAEVFIGVSSGLAWLAWAVGCKVIMISGITEEYNEFECARIINKNTCHGCFNEHKFDPGDWNWCPLYKNTPRQFECSKNIYASDITKELDKILTETQDIKKKTRFALLATYDDAYANIATVALENFKEYCDKHGYDLITKNYTNSKIRPGIEGGWDKLQIMKDLLPSYDWIFYVDCDCLIMDMNQDLESIVDDDFDFVMTKIRFYEDNPFEGGALASSAFLVRNSVLAIEYLDKCLTEECPNTWDYEMRQMRVIFNKYPRFREKLKLVSEHTLNSLWYTDIIPEWDNLSFIYEHGDFILHFAGRHNDNRAPLMKKFLEMSKDAKNANQPNIFSKFDIPQFLKSFNLNGNGIEIGVLRGAYSKALLEKWNGNLFLVDTWRKMEGYVDLNSKDDEYHIKCLLETIENTKEFADRSHIMRMTSEMASNVFPDNYFDFIYIDANHAYEYVMQDLEMWWPKLKVGGVFSGDDYIPENGDIWMVDNATGKAGEYAGKFGVKKAVNQFAFNLGYFVNHTTSESYWRQWYFVK